MDDDESDTWNKCRFSFNWCCCSCYLWCKSQYADTIWRVFRLCYAKFLKNLARNKKKLVKWMMTSRDTWNTCRFNLQNSSKARIRFRTEFPQAQFFSKFYKIFLLFTTQFCSVLSQVLSSNWIKLRNYFW